MALVCYCKPREEKRAENHLIQQGFETFLPLCRTPRGTEKTPLFPRYLFLWMPENNRWRPVSSTPGVSYLVCNGDKEPSMLDDSVVDIIRERMKKDGGAVIVYGETVQDRQFQPNQKIRIVGGSYIGFDGLYQQRRGDRIIALLNCFGRKVRASVPERHVA